LARLDVDETLGIWDRYREQTISYYGLDNKQSQQAKDILSRREAQLKSHLSDYADDIDEYQKGLKRLRDARQQPERAEVASLRAQLDSLERELAAKRGELLGPIHQMWPGTGTI